MSIDPVCHMEVLNEAAELNAPHQDYEGKRYVFCSLSCLQSFQMNPARFIRQENSSLEIGHCELCSKSIKEGEEYSEQNIHGVLFKFCCPTCAAVFQKKEESNNKIEGSAFHELQKANDPVLVQWLEEAVRQNASDLFLSAGEPPVLKIYGVFKQLDDKPLDKQTVDGFIQAIIPERKRAQFYEGHDVDIGLDIKGLSRFRVNIFRQQNGRSVAVRPLPYKIPTMEELKLPDVFQDLLRVKHGMILITGPTGSGKTTTLASFINAINQKEEKHIITIEDPVEYIIPNQRSLVHQREVGWHTCSFADGLRSALRENPDIIVVGELRDLESISLAIRAAETGHLVLGTLHSGTAIQTLTRILDVFDSERQPLIRTQLAQSLQAICSQRLIRRTDTRGMVVATEIMIATLALRNIIRQNRVQEIRGYMETGLREKMHTLKQSIQALIRAGLVSKDALEEVKEDILTI